jgi:hypothetical protein
MLIVIAAFVKEPCTPCGPADEFVFYAKAEEGIEAKGVFDVACFHGDVMRVNVGGERFGSVVVVIASAAGVA